jgi:glycine cleavage system H protein
VSPEELRYTRDHEWLRQEAGGEVRVGITDYAQSQLGDVVFVELPPVGRELKKGEPFGVVESVKSVSDLYAPVSGVVSAVNLILADAPQKVNEAPYGDGWMISLRPKDPTEVDALLDCAAYERHVASEQGR